MSAEPVVCIVDDDPAVRRSLEYMIRSQGHGVETYGSAQEFLGCLDAEQPGCILLDIRMPGMSGLQLQARLNELGVRRPVILMTAYGEVPLAIQGMKLGALDFIEKPFRRELLLELIERALQQDAQRSKQYETERSSAERLADLTSREREVMRLVVAGRSNRQIASDLEISPKTVAIHRSRVMTKTASTCVADLVRVAFNAGQATSRSVTGKILS